MGCATKEHPAGGDESGAVNNRFWRRLFEQWRIHKQRFYVETGTSKWMLASTLKDRMLYA